MTDDTWRLCDGVATDGGDNDQGKADYHGSRFVFLMRFHGDLLGAETVLSQHSGRWALMLSLAVHLLVLYSPALEKHIIKPEPVLEVYLKPIADRTLVVPEPILPELPASDVAKQPLKQPFEEFHPSKTPRLNKSPKKQQDDPGQSVLASGLTAPLRQKLAQQVRAFYPDEYVQQRIEGEVVLRLFIDPATGAVIAIRVETPSRHVLFNEAARQAALSGIPSLAMGSAPEVLLPVRFRLGHQ